MCRLHRGYNGPFLCVGSDVCAAVHDGGKRADVCMQGPEVSLTWCSSLAAHLVFEAASLTETGGSLVQPGWLAASSKDPPASASPSVAITSAHAITTQLWVLGIKLGSLCLCS